MPTGADFVVQGALCAIAVVARCEDTGSSQRVTAGRAGDWQPSSDRAGVSPCPRWQRRPTWRTNKRVRQRRTHSERHADSRRAGERTLAVLHIIAPHVQPVTIIARCKQRTGFSDRWHGRGAWDRPNVPQHKTELRILQRRQARSSRHAMAAGMSTRRRNIDRSRLPEQPTQHALP